MNVQLDIYPSVHYHPLCFWLRTVGTKVRKLLFCYIDYLIAYSLVHLHNFRLNLSQVLKTEYPKGVDIIYESVGGEMFNICLNALAVYGRFIIIGMVSQVCTLSFITCMTELNLISTYLCSQLALHISLILSVLLYLDEIILMK